MSCGTGHWAKHVFLGDPTPASPDVFRLVAALAHGYVAADDAYLASRRNQNESGFSLVTLSPISFQAIWVTMSGRRS